MQECKERNKKLPLDSDFNRSPSAPNPSNCRRRRVLHPSWGHKRRQTCGCDGTHTPRPAGTNPTPSRCSLSPIWVRQSGSATYNIIHPDVAADQPLPNLLCFSDAGWSNVQQRVVWRSCLRRHSEPQRESVEGQCGAWGLRHVNAANQRNVHEYVKGCWKLISIKSESYCVP